MQFRRRGFKCKKTVLKELICTYNDEVMKTFNNDYTSAIKDFENIAENRIRSKLSAFYKTSRSIDQAWKTCKGTLYEYAVFKCLQQIIESKSLKEVFSIVRGDESLSVYKDQIAIRNWSNIFPDVDLLLIDKKKGLVKAIISCKTSLRERLTETAFWKRELERSEKTKGIKMIFITTDKDEELKNEANRYIVLHVIDYVFITNPNRYNSLIEYYKHRYGYMKDFEELLKKIRLIDEFEKILEN